MGPYLDTAFCILALNNALANRCFPDRKLMHHSDRGLQYCSNAYVEILKENKICISMTENGDPLENALAERMNGIFKDNFALDTAFSTFEEAQRTIKNAVNYYNNRLPHSSVDMLTPNEAHYKTGDLKKHWKWYWKEKQDSKKQLELEIESGGISNQLQR